MKNAAGEEISFLKRAVQVAYVKYTQRGTELPLALIRTRKSSERMGGDASLGWSRVARGSFRSVLVEGGHFEMFDPPYLPAIAAEIDRMLRDAAG